MRKPTQHAKEDLIMADFKDKALGDDQLEEVTGGVIFNASGIIGSDSNNPWEVLDNRNGNVL